MSRRSTVAIDQRLPPPKRSFAVQALASDHGGFVNPETAQSVTADRIARAIPTLGASDEILLDAVVALLDRHDIRGGTTVDIGCGRGDLWSRLVSRFDRYIGIDVLRYDGFPKDQQVILADLDGETIDLPAECANLVVAVETVEHLENPRRLVRQMNRLLVPGGWLLITTPNQLSILSKLSVVLKNQFVAFQEMPGLYPSHITALLPTDLSRIATEQQMNEIEIAYSGRGRVPGSSAQFPGFVSRAFPRAFSDNVFLLARKGQASV